MRERRFKMPSLYKQNGRSAPPKNVELPKKVHNFQLLFSVYTIQECMLYICVYWYLHANY